MRRLRRSNHRNGSWLPVLRELVLVHFFCLPIGIDFRWASRSLCFSWLLYGVIVPRSLYALVAEQI